MATAIITGCAVRLGRAMALHLSKAGYNIALHYNRSEESAEKIISELKKSGIKCIGFKQDFNEPDGIPLLMEKIVTSFNDIELLINSASVFMPGTIEHTDYKKLQTTFSINVIAPFMLMSEYKKRVGKGQIINILDQRILKNNPSHSAYSVTKAALAHLTLLGAVEFGPNIRVNGIAPGLILPNSENHDESYFMERGKSIPLKKTGDINAIMQGLDYLVANNFVSGDILFIDGGESKSCQPTTK